MMTVYDPYAYRYLEIVLKLAQAWLPNATEEETQAIEYVKRMLKK